MGDAEKKEKIKCYNTNGQDKRGHHFDVTKKAHKDPYELRAMKNAKDKIRTRLVQLNGSNMS